MISEWLHALLFLRQRLLSFVCLFANPGPEYNSDEQKKTCKFRTNADHEALFEFNEKRDDKIKIFFFGDFVKNEMILELFGKNAANTEKKEVLSVAIRNFRINPYPWYDMRYDRIWNFYNEKRDGKIKIKM